MHFGTKRRILLGAFIGGAILVAAVVFATVNRPYAHPIIAEVPGGHDASFDGISQLISDARQRGTMVHVLWAHGMCTHHVNWATDRAMRIATALGGTAVQTGIDEEIAGLTRVLYEFKTPGGDFDATFIVWSPMTERYKRELDFDAPGSNAATSFPYERATMNGALKTGLINDCLSDALVYAGQHGDPLRAAMKLAVCRDLGGTPVAGRPCDLTVAASARPTAVITESLGSKILFDAARAVYDESVSDPAMRAAMTERFASVQMIYLLANQIPLLDIATPLPMPQDADSQEKAAPHASSADHMIGVIHRARSALPPDRLATIASPTLIAFTDPNDLLSYRLIPSVLGDPRARVINVIASNDTTWFGYFERPDMAHCGYASNRIVLGLIAHGHKVGEPLPEAPAIDSTQCL